MFRTSEIISEKIRAQVFIVGSRSFDGYKIIIFLLLDKIATKEPTQ